MHCPAVLQSGPRRGESCNRDPCDPTRYSAYCRYHYLTAVKQAEEKALGNEPAQSTPLCALNDSRAAVYSDAFVECVICLQNVHYTEMAAFLPCAHVCVCVECAEQTSVDARKGNRLVQCPLCRSQVSGAIRLFFASALRKNDGDRFDSVSLEDSNKFSEHSPLLGGTGTTSQNAFWKRFRSFLKIMCNFCTAECRV